MKAYTQLRFKCKLKTDTLYDLNYGTGDGSLSHVKDLLWLANDIAYFDSKWGLLDPVSVSISFEEEY